MTKTFETDFANYEPLKMNNKYRVNKIKGTIINEKNKIIGNITSCGYIQVRIDNKLYMLHRVIYSNYYPIPDGLVVDHIDNNNQNNKLSNLQVLTTSQNIKKDYVERSTLAKRIIATFTATGEKVKFESMYEAGYALNINSGSIMRACSKHASHKFAYTIPYGVQMSFEYDDSPVQTISEDEKKAQKKLKMIEHTKNQRLNSTTEKCELCGGLYNSLQWNKHYDTEKHQIAEFNDVVVADPKEAALQRIAKIMDEYKADVIEIKEKDDSPEAKKYRHVFYSKGLRVLAAEYEMFVDDDE